MERDGSGWNLECCAEKERVTLHAESPQNSQIRSNTITVPKITNQVVKHARSTRLEHVRCRRNPTSWTDDQTSHPLFISGRGSTEFRGADHVNPFHNLPVEEDS